MNNQSLIGRFKDCLSWVTTKTGKHFEIWNEYNTTKSCSNCNYVHPQGFSPDIRWWKCPSCNKVHHRDENSSLNGLKKIFTTLPCLGHLEAVKPKSRCSWKFSGLGISQRDLRGPKALEVYYITDQSDQGIK